MSTAKGNKLRVIMIMLCVFLAPKNRQATKQNQPQGLGGVIPKVLFECGNIHKIVYAPLVYHNLPVFSPIGELSSCFIVIHSYTVYTPFSDLLGNLSAD